MQTTKYHLKGPADPVHSPFYPDSTHAPPNDLTVFLACSAVGPGLAT